MTPRAGRLTWLLDLDNTLYDSGAVIMPRVNQAIGDFVARKLEVSDEVASRLRVQYWRRYGATLLGLIHHHGVDPHEYLRDTHQFPDLHELVRRHGALAQMLRRLPGRKILLTNAPHHYASGVIEHMGIAPIFDRVVCIEDMQFAGRWQPKPSVAMMRRLCARLRLDPARCVLVEDSMENLLAARRCRMRTVWVHGFHRRAQQSRLAAPVASADGKRPLLVPGTRQSRHPEVDFQIQSVLTLARIPISRDP